MATMCSTSLNHTINTHVPKCALKIITQQLLNDKVAKTHTLHTIGTYNSRNSLFNLCHPQVYTYVHYDDIVQYMMKRCEAVIASFVTMLSSWAAMWREHVRTGFT